MKTSIPRKFMSLRGDRNSGSHRRSKSSDPATQKNRPPASEVFFSYFKSDAAKQAAKEEEEKANLAAKIEEFSARLEELHITDIAPEHVRYVLLSRYAEGNVNKAVELMRFQRDAFSGVILPYNPNTKMQGAENRFFVTCYLDSLLFAMFARLQAFDCMLKTDLPDGPARKLAALLRLWVNMLRSGKLIHADMMEHLQESLAECGWPDARLTQQQDTSEAFVFITETLQLPLLTLQVDLFHQGKRDDDDHKVVYERLLNLAVPPDPDGKGIKLEDCLEDYFNTKVDVLRDSLVDKEGKERFAVSPGASQWKTTPTASPMPLVAPNASAPPTASTCSEESVSASSVSLDTTVSSEAPNCPTSTAAPATPAAPAPGTPTKLDDVQDVQDAQDVHTAASQDGSAEAERKSETFDRDPAPIHRRWTMLEPYGPNATEEASSSSDPRSTVNGRQRSASIIQRIVLDEARPANVETSTLLQQFKRQGSTIIKAVTIPAWQFFRLIPWHAASNNEPIDDIDVARQFKNRPVVGICLKRYMMTNNGVFQRQNTYIDIPESLRLPYFMMAEDGRTEGSNGLTSEYKLVLQSVVCHRGASLHSGHYISFARVNPKILTDNRRQQVDPPPDYEEEQWVRFDDLAVGERVSYVEDIREALKAEMPYLLFYQIVPMVDLTPSTTGGTAANEPPSYMDSTNTERSEPTPGIRFSADLDRVPRISLDEESNSISRKSGPVSRRESIIFTDSVTGTPIVTPEGGRSPVVLPTTTPEETTAQRFSRAAARFAGMSRSRPVSQAGEGRISMTMSRLGGLVRSSRELLRQPEDGTDAISGLSLGGSSVTANSTTPASSTPAPHSTHSSISILPDGVAAAEDSTTQKSQKDQKEQKEQTENGHHHHHHHHHGLRRSKGKNLLERDSEDDNTDSGGSKGKDKEKEKTKLGVPERECNLM